MKKTKHIPILLSLLALPSISQASMTFISTGNITTAAGASVTAIANDTSMAGSFYGQPMGSYENIEITARADMDGKWQMTASTLRFTTGADLLTGETICITMTSNIQLATHTRADNAGRRKGAIYARINDNNATTTTLNGSSSMTITGGNNTLADYAGGSTPTIAAGDTTYQSGNDFVYNQIAGSLAGVAGSTQFDSFTGTDTMNFLTGADINGQNGSTIPNQYSVAITDSHTSSLNDFSWQSFTFCYTNTSTDPLVEGTRLRFTVDGMNPDAQQALIPLVPEPSSLALLSLSILGLISRRKK